MSGKTICLVKPTNTLKYCFNDVFLFHFFLVITVSSTFLHGLEAPLKLRLHTLWKKLFLINFLLWLIQDWTQKLGLRFDVQKKPTDELHIPLNSWSLHSFSHRLSKITDRTLDVVFSRFSSISFTITLRQKPKGVTRIIWVKQALSLSCNSTEREPVLRRLRVNPVGFCFKVIVNEILLNLEKTTSTGIFFYFN